MKKTLICIALMALASNAMAELRTWKLTSVPAADAANMTADANWKVDSKNRHCYTLALNNEPAMANGASVSMVEGLKFTITASSDGNLPLRRRHRFYVAGYQLFRHHRMSRWRGGKD